MSVPPRDIEAHVEAAVRRYLTRLALRTLPAALILLAVVLIVALVPRVDERSAPSTARPAESVAPGGTAAGGFAASAPSAAQGIQTSIPLTPGSGLSSGEPGAHATGPGFSRGGVRCAPGTLQVQWAVYAPPCVTAFRGDNGGASSHGVTRSTITLSYRLGNSTQDAAVNAASEDAAPAPDPVYLQDMRSYIALFNRTYELYGRKVVLKEFQGQGDYISEDQGQGQAQAAADAATARGLGAFADVTFVLKGSLPYWTSLARQRVIAIGPVGFPQSYYERYRPYWWTFYPTGSQGAQLIGNGVCRRMAGLPAAFAGDPVMRRTPRVFGLIAAENPEYEQVGDEIETALGRCGVRIKHRERYAFNVVTYQGQAVNMVAQMQREGVTTVLCNCDPLIPIFLTQAADGQRYEPEWYEPWWRDPQGRLPSQNQWAHALSNGPAWPSRSRDEPYRVFKIAEPKIEPRQRYYDLAYMTLQFLFRGLQAAGPTLTPDTFARGMFSLPPSAVGTFGTWGAGTGNYTPQVNTQIAWWDPNARSTLDGKTGAWRACEEGRWFRFDQPSSWGTPRTQLSCFGH
jgi:hypothetical protein